MYCLLPLMELSIFHKFMFSKSAKDIWDGVATPYSQKKTYARIYELQLKPPPTSNKWRGYAEHQYMYDPLKDLKPKK